MNFLIKTLIFTVVLTVMYCLFTGIIAWVFDFTWLEVKCFPISVIVLGGISCAIAAACIVEIEDKNLLKSFN